MKFEIIFRSYTQDSTFVILCDNFSNALKKGMKLSSFIQEELNWTRHNSINGPINHYNYYGDLYNEGHVTVQEFEQPIIPE